jgi:putative nucleotidyltransferase with HDIG domain
MVAPTKPSPQPGAKSPEAQAALVKLFTRISEISTLPTVAQQIIQIAGDERSGASDLLRAIETDPAMAARVLRRVNSSYYALRNNVADLQMAISLLGFREVRNLALTVYVARIFRDCGDIGYYNREALWDHLVAVAAGARLICQVCRRGSPDEAYTAGLLHDIGLILMDQYLRNHFCKVIQQLSETETTPQVEHKVFPFDHGELGAFVIERWNFAQQIVDAARFHHTPETYKGAHGDIVHAVAVANYLVSRSGFPALGVHNVSPPGASVYAALGLHESQLAEICRRLDPALESATSMAAL